MNFALTIIYIMENEHKARQPSKQLCSLILGYVVPLLADNKASS